MKIDYNKPILNKNGEPLKLLESAAHHCIRCIKKTTALSKLGYMIYGMGDKDTYGAELYESYFVWHNERQFKDNVRICVNLGVDAITWDNEPDHPVRWIREVLRDMNVEDRVKLIVDLHDLDSIRRGFIPKDEREMFNYADALIYVSLPIQKMTNELHKITIPNTVIYSYCNKGIVEYDEGKVKERSGLVYEGGANPPTDDELNMIFSYRSLYNIIKRLVNMGNETHMYCGNVSAFETYQNTGAILHPPTMYDKMMNELVQYKYGVLIFNNEDGKKDQVNYTLTNKEEEYLQAGVPSLACWCPESMKHVKKHGIGFTFEHIDEVRDCSQLESMYLETMDNIKIKRNELVMENFIWRLENLYAEVLDVEKKDLPDEIRKLSEFEYGDV